MDRRQRIYFMAVALVGCCLWMTGCQCYQLGNQAFFRNDIRTVHVAILESNSNRRFLGQRFTEAITKRISSSTPLLITSPDRADSFITGRLLRERKRITGETVTDEGRSLEVSNIIEFRWVDRQGTPLTQRQSIRLDFDAELIPEGGQSLATAQQEIIDRIAREVVGQMELPW